MAAKIVGKKRRGSSWQRRQDRLGYFFMAPWIIGFFLFSLIPFLATIYLSFSNVNSTVLGYEISFAGRSN